MKLEVRMYVRTKNGEIDKILYIDYADERRKKYPTHPSNKYWRDKILLEHKGYRVTNQSIKKASHNIIDLIEIGDIILFRLNGDLYKYEVEEIPSFDKYLKVISMNICKQRKIFELNELNILGILTKEQFENNCFKIGDE